MLVGSGHTTDQPANEELLHDPRSRTEMTVANRAPSLGTKTVTVSGA